MQESVIAVSSRESDQSISMDSNKLAQIERSLAEVRRVLRSTITNAEQSEASVRADLTRISTQVTAVHRTVRDMSSQIAGYIGSEPLPTGPQAALAASQANETKERANLWRNLALLAAALIPAAVGLTAWLSR